MPDYIVSLTTIPSRFEFLMYTINSLLEQTIKPKQIIVNIPNTYSFRFDNASVDEYRIKLFVDKYPQVVLNFIDTDYGPGTKLLGLLNSTLLADVDKTHTYLVLVDDDAVYEPSLIEFFHNRVTTNDKIEAASYTYDTYNNITLGSGMVGFFMKLSILDNFLEYYNIIKGQDYLQYLDDFYISYYFYLINTPIFGIYTPGNKPSYIYLHNFNVDALQNIKDKYSKENLYTNSYTILEDINTTGGFNFLKPVATDISGADASGADASSADAST